MINAASFPGAFLQTAFAKNVGGGFASDYQNWLFVSIGIGDTGHQIGSTGSCGGNTGRDFTRGFGVTTRHKRRSLFVFGQDGMDAGIIEAVIHRENVCTWHTENIFNTQLFHVFNN